MHRRNTIQKEIVLQAVLFYKGHPTADDVYQVISLSHPTISKGTVYRNLNLLSEEGRIHKVLTFGNWPDHFDHTTMPHYHAVCENCGKIVDVDYTYQKEMEDQIRESDGFIITSHELVFHGLCPECQNKMHLLDADKE